MCYLYFCYNIYVYNMTMYYIKRPISMRTNQEPSHSAAKTRETDEPVSSRSESHRVSRTLRWPMTLHNISFYFEAGVLWHVLIGRISAAREIWLDYPDQTPCAWEKSVRLSRVLMCGPHWSDWGIFGANSWETVLHCQTFRCQTHGGFLAD